jgi:hypothetical protein
MNCLAIEMEAITNPVIESIFTETGHRIEINRVAHALRITALYDWEKPIKEEVFDQVHQFCKEYRIGFNIRPFDTTKKEDRDEVIKLPGFHVYYESEYEQTFYLEENPKEIVLEIIKKYKPKKWNFSWRGVQLPKLYRVRRIMPILSSEGNV